MTIRGGSGFPVDLTVSRGTRNRIRMSAAGRGGDSWSRSMTIQGAAEIVRVLRGHSENEYFGVQGLPGVDPLGFRHFIEWDGDPNNPGYELYDRSGNTKGRTLCTLNMADAVALELALERAIIDSVYETYQEAWLLVAVGKLVVAGPCPGVDPTVVRTALYASREKACDSLREFMRVGVNDAQPDDYWDGADETVDDVLDSIFEGNHDLESNGNGLWQYDGTVRSYEWRLIRLGVRT